MMISREESYNKAFALKSDRLRSRLTVRQKELESLAEKNSRIGELEGKISALGAQVAITALSGDTAALEKLRNEITALSDEKAAICSGAGVGEMVYDCPVCRDTGYTSGKICECVHRLAKELRLSALSGEFPTDDCRFENFDLGFYPDTTENGASPRKKMTQLLKLCREYVINFNKNGVTPENLLFMGDSGLGKTHISLAIVYELTQKGFDVIYGSAFNLFSSMENEHFSGRNNESYKAAVECDLLVIDDLGSEFVTPFIQTLVYNIINTRLLAKKPIIINTNLTMQEIENKYTPRITSRLIGSFNARRFVGRDIRQLKKLGRV